MPSLPRHEVNLILAFQAYYSAEPQQVNYLLTGVCEWPPQDSYATLLRRARDAIADINEVTNLGLSPQSGPRLCQVLAAAKVLETFEHNRCNPAAPFEASEAVTARVTELLGPIAAWNTHLAGMIAAGGRRP